jgi:hypothetical protein
MKLRYVDPILKSRIEKANQTLYENANPAIVAWISRRNIPLIDQTFLEYIKIDDYINIGDVSISARRSNENRQSDGIFVAFTDNGTGKILYATQTPVITDYVWTTVETIPDATDIATAFDGRMIKNIRGNIAFKTIDLNPWVFWIDAAGLLYGKLLGDDSTQVTLANANASAVTAVRGIQSDIADFDQGLLVFFILAGSIHYRTFRNGIWEDAAPINFGPSVTWVDISASRTWDYRIVLQAKDNSGNIYELFTQTEGIAKQNVERIEITDITAEGESIPVTYFDTSEDERIEVTDITATGEIIYGLSPVPTAVGNVEDTSDE